MLRSPLRLWAELIPPAVGVEGECVVRAAGRRCAAVPRVGAPRRLLAASRSHRGPRQGWCFCSPLLEAACEGRWGCVGGNEGGCWLGRAEPPCSCRCPRRYAAARRLPRGEVALPVPVPVPRPALPSPRRYRSRLIPEGTFRGLYRLQRGGRWGRQIRLLGGWGGERRRRDLQRLRAGC